MAELSSPPAATTTTAVSSTTSVVPSMELPGLLTRLLALFVDVVILTPWTVMVATFEPRDSVEIIAVCIIVILIPPIYHVLMHTMSGQTCGKMLTHIQLKTTGGERLGLTRSVIRSGVDFGFAALLIISVVMTLWLVPDTSVPGIVKTGLFVYINIHLPLWGKLVVLFYTLWVISEAIVPSFRPSRRSWQDGLADSRLVRIKL